MINLSNNKTSILIKSQVPQFVRDEHGLFVEFLESYYKFLEQDGQLSYVSKNFLNYLDIDNIYQDIIEDEAEEEVEEFNDYHAFLQKFYDNFTALIPDSILSDKTLLLKHAKEFYRARGSEKSIQFLMRALYASEVEFYYPKNDILRVSDGKWFIEKSLNVKDFAVNNVANSTAFSLFKSKQIRGAVSNSTCDVETVDQYYDNGVLVTELKISNVEQDFENGEQLFTFFEEEGEVKFLSCNLFSGIIISTTVTKGGSGYVQGASVPVEAIEVDGLEGSGALIIISKVAKANLEGKIKTIEVANAGAGFVVGDTLLFTGGGGGKNAAAQISIVDITEDKHPSYYDIVGSRIIDVANVTLSNTYSNLANIWIQTSNLTLFTGPTSTNLANLSLWSSNSDIYFEVGDMIRVNNEYVYITSKNLTSNTINVSPALSANLFDETFTVYKRPNANNTVEESMIFWTYGPCGPVQAAQVTNEGFGYFTLPTIDVRSNTYVKELGILGRMDIYDGGLGYEVGDILEFVNDYGDYGEGANGVVTVVDANGVIQGVQFTERTGYTVGGMGYSMLALPNVNVISANVLASNADIRVTAIIGDGEHLEPTSNVIGTIEQLKIISGGAGYSVPPTINLASQGDGTAQAYANVVTGIYTYPGRYVNDDGHISGYNFLQDRDYYQPFSYVIKSGVSLEKYRKAIKELSHPAGMILFGQYVFEDKDANTEFANVTNTFTFTSNSYANVVVYFDMANTMSYTVSGEYEYLTYDYRTGDANSAANLNNVYYDTSNIWYNAANANQYGTLNENAYFLAGGVVFNGARSNDAVIVNHTDSLNTQSLMTYITWFNASNTRANKYLVSKYNESNTNGFRMAIEAANLIVYIGDSTTDNVIRLGTVNTNTWYQAAFTYEGINLRGYLNGQYVTMSSNTSNANTDTAGNLYIGSTNGFRPNTFQGKIAVAEIYDKRMSDAEIARTFENYRKRFGI